MAAIGRRSILFLAILPVAAALVCSPLLADTNDELQVRVGYLANALSSGEPADAISVFDKSCPKYEVIRQNFDGLTSAFDLNNEVDVTNLDSTGEAAKLTVNWTLTLNDRFSNETENRTQEINMTFERKNGKWMIVEFGPIDLFSPLKKRVGKH